MNTKFLLPLWVLGTICICLNAQNYVPNPGFENVVTCPTGISQFNGRLTDWTAANSASPDYAACGVTGNVAIRNNPRTGGASAGMWGGASHPSCTGSAYAEAIQVGLTTTLLAGSSIDLSFSVQVDGQGTATSGPNSCVNFGVYLYHSSSPPATNGWCCFNVTPQFSVVGGVIQQGTYTTFTSTIVATGNYNRLIVGPFCNANTNGAGCSNYTATRMYFNVDDMVVQPATVLQEAPLQVNGKAFLEFNLLDWSVEEDAPYSRFFVEQSTDGVIFKRLGEVERSGPEQTEFEYREDLPSSGTTFYRLTAEEPGGNWVHSNVIEIVSGVQASHSDTQFTYGYDRSQEILKIHPGTDEKQPLWLVIRDMSGKEIYRYHWQTEKGKWVYEVPVGHLAHGLYVLELGGNQGKITGFNKWVKF